MRKKPKKIAGGKINSCIDWYIITTTCFSWGCDISEQYAFTTCDGGGCEEESSRTGRINCNSNGGAVASNGSPSFPSSPNNNDEYEFTSKEGEYTRYKYSSVANIWVAVERILPPLVVSTQPENYSFLNIQWPVNGLEVFGTDHLLYTYNGSNSDWYGEITVVEDSPETPILNMADFLKCFTNTQAAIVTIYADQPVANSSDAYQVTLGGAVVGHTFVSITQGTNRAVFGFYPNVDPTPFSPSVPSAMGDDSSEAYDVSVSVTVSGSVLQQVISYATNYAGTYDLNNYNCSDFGIAVGNLAGLNLPDCYASWYRGGGSNPGVLGQYIRSITPTGSITTNTSGGTAPTKNCN